jgi:hypothetical protein
MLNSYFLIFIATGFLIKAFAVAFRIFVSGRSQGRPLFLTKGALEVDCVLD